MRDYVEKMNLEQYKKWLEEHANKEERQAYAVVERIVEYHQNRAYANLMKMSKRAFNTRIVWKNHQILT